MSRIALNVDSYEGNDIPLTEIARFVVLYGKASTRKHKIWEGDGLLVCYTDSCILKSEDERDVICRSSALKNLDQLEDGRIINIGSWSVEIQEKIEKRVSVPMPKGPLIAPPILHPSDFVTPPMPAKRPSFTTPPLMPIVRKNSSASRDATMPCALNPPLKKKPKIGSTTDVYSFTKSPPKATKRASFVPPLIGSTTDDGVYTTTIQQPVSPYILNKQDILEERSKVAVVLDPRFTKQVRQHQKEGIQFIYDRLHKQNGGVILADDMGLGKSIQTMAATWALMKGSRAKQLTHSCLIIVPSSLVNNWKAEFEKWWRMMRFPAVIVQTAKDIISYQSTIKQMPYLVISYDLAQRHVEKLRPVKFDIIVCDEAHKLKNLDGKLRKALISLEISRRLILTGTPMQNDYDEFYSLLNFVQPSVFESLSDFRRMCNDNPEQLNQLIDDCMIRRTAADVNMTHLPEKHEYILFCGASEIQKNIHTEICDYMTGDPLSLIFFARQLANHPKLLLDNLRDKHGTSTSKPLKQIQKHSALLLAFDGPNMPRGGVHESGKLQTLVEMMRSFRNLGECAVIVSNYIETLDMIENLCQFLEFKVFRLDGRTHVQDRQKMVRTFNDASDPSNIFLLSTKAGGVGLNLVGASRLVLYDSDWNPATDQQAMARIWRDGQVRPCHIYRLITTGTIEEKMLQRQIKKTGLGCVIDAIDVGESVSTFTDDDLKDIFTFTGEQTECNTHDLCGCKCDGCGMLENEMDDEEDEEEDDCSENMNARQKPTNAIQEETSEDVEETQQPPAQVKNIPKESDDWDSDDNVEDSQKTTVVASTKTPKVPKQSDDWDSDDDESNDDEELEADITLEKSIQQQIFDRMMPERPETPVSGEEEEEEEGEQAPERPRNTASLAELSRWRHFSPRHPDTWHHFMLKAGFAQENDVNLTFAFCQESQY